MCHRSENRWREIVWQVPISLNYKLDWLLFCCLLLFIMSLIVELYFLHGLFFAFRLSLFFLSEDFSSASWVACLAHSSRTAPFQPCLSASLHLPREWTHHRHHHHNLYSSLHGAQHCNHSWASHHHCSVCARLLRCHSSTGAIANKHWIPCDGILENGRKKKGSGGKSWWCETKGEGVEYLD